MVDTDLNQGMRCIKYLLFLFNLLFVITGILIIGVALTVQYVYFSFDEFLSASYYSPAILLFVVGGTIFVVAFFGCCGAVRESTCMIMVFAVLLGVIFVLELSAAIAGCAMQDEVMAGIWGNMNETMTQYPNDPAAKETVDFTHQTLGCCGVDRPLDWRGIVTLGKDTIPLKDDENDTYYVPDSCCAIYYADGSISNVTDKPYCQYIYGNGCANRLAYVVQRSAVTLTSAAVCLALLQILGVVFACSLGKTIRRHKTERERRRWELREKLISSYAPPKTTYPVVYVSPAASFEC